MTIDTMLGANHGNLRIVHQDGGSESTRKRGRELEEDGH
jgi:hypothetical protein